MPLSALPLNFLVGDVDAQLQAFLQAKGAAAPAGATTGASCGERSSSPATLPAGWERKRTPDDVCYYVDHNTRTTHWEPPMMNAARAHAMGQHRVDTTAADTTATSAAAWWADVRRRVVGNVAGSSRACSHILQIQVQKGRLLLREERVNAGRAAAVEDEQDERGDEWMWGEENTLALEEYTRWPGLAGRHRNASGGERVRGRARRGRRGKNRAGCGGHLPLASLEERGRAQINF